MHLDWILQQSNAIVGYLVRHICLSVAPVLVGLLIAIPCAWLLSHTPRFKLLFLNAFSLLYTIPSLALFIIVPGILGTRILDSLNVYVALSIYSFALLVRIVSDGLESIPADVTAAALAIGYRPLQKLLAVDLPICVPVIGAGTRVATAASVSVVSVASLVGIPQLGTLFTQGFQLGFLTPVVVGIVLSVVLAIVLDTLIVVIMRSLSKWRPVKTHD
ncbi:ABC transporter permease [Paraburkholderia flagellata]|uniref:ABC transporter permease n=1 Tax=Paraburkholderia flagellata TaxID=2883241 RepID=UPI001F1DE55A|nr:ABC transporter permease subunit [Paraburkholderia flagellata]